MADATFCHFRAFMRTPPRAAARATLVGTFFNGTMSDVAATPTGWGGFGQFGCCSLLVIQVMWAKGLRAATDRPLIIIIIIPTVHRSDSL